MEAWTTALCVDEAQTCFSSPTVRNRDEEPKRIIEATMKQGRGRKKKKTCVSFFFFQNGNKCCSNVNYR